MLRDLRRAQRSQRRGEVPPKWRRYESPAGKVPKDLVTMFAGISTQQVPRPPRPVLTDGELGALSAVLGFIDRHGARRLLSVTHVDGEATPTTEKVKTAKGPLIELKISSARNDPRFLFVVCNDVAVFLTAFAKKTQRLPRTEIARADDRCQSMEGGCS